MPQTIEVRFKGNRRAFYQWPNGDEPLRLQEAVIVEAERGLDLGRVSAVGEIAQRKCGSACGASCGVGESSPGTPAPKVVRRAAREEVSTANELRKSEEEVRRKVIERVRQHQLTMKVSDAEWQWDRNKLTVYFTAEKRVDFRALVRDLASLFRTRIELRQIGVRDEAARLSGVGRCGREYCCSSWLPELSPVNLSLAKDQHLSLNPQQISGGCGRLLCCLRYEHDFYVASRKRFPKEGRTVQTGRGVERVIAVDIFRERVFLRSEEHGPRIVALVELREEVDRLAASGAPRPAAGGEAAPAPAPATPSEPTPTAAAGPARKRRRRRGRRGRGGGGVGGTPPKPTES